MGGYAMAKRKKKGKAQPTRLAKRKSALRKRARKISSPTKRKQAKRIHRGTKRKVAQKTQAIKPSSAPSVETLVVDVIEEPVPGVITVTEFEETDIRGVNREEE
jgi:hypothetical protein